MRVLRFSRQGEVHAPCFHKSGIGLETRWSSQPLRGSMLRWYSAKSERFGVVPGRPSTLTPSLSAALGKGKYKRAACARKWVG